MAAFVPCYENLTVLSGPARRDEIHGGGLELFLTYFLDVLCANI